MSAHPLHWAAEHPVPVAIGVFAVGALILLMTSGGGGGSQAGAGMSSFYAAQAAQSANNASVATTQSNNNAALGISKIQADASTAMNANNNSTAVTLNQSNNNLSAYETYKQSRLNLQQSQEAQYLASTGGNLDAFVNALANINHGVSFGTAH